MSETRIELTVDVNYVPGWGFFEGVRELMQNARDARVEAGGELSVEWSEGKLRIENEGAGLSREVLLFGRTSKAGRAGMAGKWGEGMKLGVLALCRAGYKVSVRSGAETWSPAIERSDKFDADVLAFRISSGGQNRNRVRVEVECPRAEWEEVRDKFLFLSRETDGDRVETEDGALLLAPRFKGRVYVKGIYVTTEPSLKMGYDFAEANLDRDRRVLASWDLNQGARKVWIAALAERPSLADEFYKLLEKRAPDVEGMSFYSDQISPQVLESVAFRFAERHGAGVAPAANLNESREVGHHGKRGVVVGEAMLEVLKSAGVKTAAEVVEDGAEEVSEVFSWDDLKSGEKAALESAARLVSGAVVGFSMASVDVVSFRDPDLQGLHKNGRELIARSSLKSHSLALEVLVHEVAHSEGGDGEKGHVQEVERTWAAIVDELRRAAGEY